MMLPVLYTAALLVLPVAAAVMPVAGRPVAIVVSADASPAEAARVPIAAGGRLLSVDPDRSLVFAVFDEPGFARRLWRAGAWLAVDAATLQLCLEPTFGRRSSP